MNFTNHVESSLLEARLGLDALIANKKCLQVISHAASVIVNSLNAGGRIFSCGNGGSMCDAMHFAEELSGRYRGDRPALAAIAISDVSHLTCVANDYGYEFVFSRFLEAHARVGDVLLAISTSGASKSILNAAIVAGERGCTVIGLHGRPGSELELQSDYSICTPAGHFADRVQELHIKVLHILIECVERTLCSENYSTLC